jgi:hypothetical protein
MIRLVLVDPDQWLTDIHDRTHSKVTFNEVFTHLIQSRVYSTCPLDQQELRQCSGGNLGLQRESRVSHTLDLVFELC